MEYWIAYARPHANPDCYITAGCRALYVIISVDIGEWRGPAWTDINFAHKTCKSRSSVDVFSRLNLQSPKSYIGKSFWKWTFRPPARPPARPLVCPLVSCSLYGWPLCLLRPAPRGWINFFRLLTLLLHSSYMNYIMSHVKRTLTYIERIFLL